MRLKLETDQGDLIFKTDIISDSLLDVKSHDELIKELKKLMPGFEDAIKIFISRHDDYGNTWEMDEFSNHEVLLNALVCLTKTKRICSILDRKKPGTIPITKLANNAVDLINYSNFLLHAIKKRVIE